MHCEKKITVGTPVLLRLESGKEATGQVAFCKGSPTDNKLWGVGVVLNERGNFWGFNPCPEDWLVSNEDAAASPDDRGISSNVGNIPESKRTRDIIHAEAGTLRVELREQMRKEMDAILTDARASVQESLADTLQSLPETLDRKVTEGVENALQQVEDRMNTLTRLAQSEAEQLQQKLRSSADELEGQVQQAFSGELEKAQQQFREVANTCVEEKKQEIADATASMRQASDQVYCALQQRLENEFEGKQEIIGSLQHAITTEEARLREEVGNVDDRIAKLEEFSTQLEANFSGRLDQTVSETIAQGRTSLEKSLGELRNEQMGMARTEMENMLTPVSTCADSLIKELRLSVDMLTRERDETQVQISAMRQEKEEMQLWLAQQDQDLRKAMENALFDARAQGKTIVQKALDMIQDPVERLSCEAKIKIEEFTTRQHADLGEGIQRLRDVLATLERQAEDSLRMSFQAISETPNHSDTLAPDKLEPEAHDAAAKSIGGQTTFAQKLSGLVRGHGGKRE